MGCHMLPGDGIWQNKRNLWMLWNLWIEPLNLALIRFGRSGILTGGFISRFKGTAKKPLRT